MLTNSKFMPQPRDPGPNPLDTSSEELKKKLEAAKNIIILIRDNPKTDHVAAGLGLYLALKKTDKSVVIACPTPMRVEFNRLVGVDKVVSSIGNRNLIIAFPNSKESIETVSYSDDDVNLNLIIKPKAGYPALDSSKVEYSYSGVEADLVFVIGAAKLEDLGVFYQAEKKLFESSTVVNIDSSLANKRFGQINLVWSEFSSTSEIITQVIERLNLSLDQDIATNLLSGLNDATQNFQRWGVKANAHQVAAKLMQAGAKSQTKTPDFPKPGISPTFTPPNLSRSNPSMPQSPSFRTSPFTPSPQALGPLPNPRLAESSNIPVSSQSQPQVSNPPVQPTPLPPTQASPAIQTPNQQTDSPTPQAIEPALPQTPTPTQTPPQPLPPASLSNQPLGSESNQNNNSNPTSSIDQDWLKPKIYTGSSKLDN